MLLFYALHSPGQLPHDISVKGRFIHHSLKDKLGLGGKAGNDGMALGGRLWWWDEAQK